MQFLFLMHNNTLRLMPRLKFFFFLLSVSSTLVFSFKLKASSSIVARGHAAAVSEFDFGFPPDKGKLKGIRVPLGLGLEANVGDSFQVFFELDYWYNNAPKKTLPLGTGSFASLTASPQSLPFADLSINKTNDPLLPGVQRVGSKSDNLSLMQAYFKYTSPFGIFQAGRMPRNWGLGLWRNARWNPFFGRISTADALSFESKLGVFDLRALFEKSDITQEGQSGSSCQYTIEAKIIKDPLDSDYSGFKRDVGVAYSYYVHDASKTSLSHIDAYSTIFYNEVFLGLEGLYVWGDTKSPNYFELGGAYADEGELTGSKQQVNAFAVLLKANYLLDSSILESEKSIYSYFEASQKLASYKRPNSQVLGFWGGMSSGSKDQFKLKKGKGDIKALPMHPNIRPSFLMFNDSLPERPGMPSGRVVNTSFLRLDYSYENSSFGKIQPILVWAMLNQTNPVYGQFCQGNDYGDKCLKDIDNNDGRDISGLGKSKNLGVEIDVQYRYTTESLVTLGADVAYWFVGDAWKQSDGKKSNAAYGFRFSIAKEF